MPNVNDYRKKKKIRLTYKGETHTVQEWSRIVGIHPAVLYNRRSRGWRVERILTEPVRNTGGGMPAEDLKYHPIYNFILKFARENGGNVPSLLFIGRELDKSKDYVRYWVQRMVEAGLLYYNKYDDIMVVGGRMASPQRRGRGQDSPNRKRGLRWRLRWKLTKRLS